MGADLRFDESAVEEGRNFANKLYNACRFRQMAGTDCCEGIAETAGLPPYHLNVMSRLDELATDLEEAYADYRFGEIAQRLYEFLWNDFCDKFLEAVKLDLRESATPEARAMTLGTFDAVMSRYLQLLHPYMPHITEELWKGLGYYMVIFLAGLQGISPDLYEAAALDGSEGLRKHLDITLPLLRPYITLVAVISAIAATKVFEEVYLMTQGGPADATKTLVYYVYDQAFAELEISYACTVGLALFVIVLLLSLVRFAFAGDKGFS